MTMLLAGRCHHGAGARQHRARSLQAACIPAHSQHQQQPQRQQQPSPSTSGRRDMLAIAFVAGLGLSVSPAEYRRAAQQLVKGMRETIELELSGAPEREVRRKAEESNVKTLVREFINKWQESPAVFNEPSRAEIKAAVVELGAFYQQYGSRSALPNGVSSSILAHLSAAEQVLGPVEEKKGLLSRILMGDD